MCALEAKRTRQLFTIVSATRMTTVLTQEQLTQPETENVREKLLTLQLTGSPIPLVLGNALDGFQKSNLTPIIGTEFARGVQLAKWLKASNADELIRDLAITGG